jgi:hypothetical protein
MSAKQFLFLILFATSKITIAQQTHIIKGKVLDSITGLPIAFASVVIIQNKLIKCFTKSDEKGSFEFTCKVTLPSFLEASIVGFSSQSIGINETPEHIYVFRLNKKFLLQDTVKVESKINYFKKGDTTFIKAAAYLKGDEDNLSELLKKIPNVDVTESGMISIGGKSVDRILIEGKDILGKDYGKLVNNLPPKNISEFQFIENYKDEEEDNQRQENVLNIKFKYKSKIKGGKITAALQAMSLNSQLKGDILLSDSKISGYHIFNANKIGEISDVIIGDEYTDPFDILLPLSQIKGKQKFGKYYSFFLKEKNYLNNNTLLIDNNQIFQINKRLKIKQQLFLSTEKLIPISSKEESNFFNGIPIATTIETNKTEHFLQKINSKTLLNYKLSKNRKLKLEADIRLYSDKNNLLGYLNNKPNELNFSTINFNSFISAEYKQYFNGINYLTYRIDYVFQKQNLYQAELGREFLNFNDGIGIVNDVAYIDNYKSNNINVGLGYTIRSKKISRELSFNLLKSKCYFNLDNNFKGKIIGQSNYTEFIAFNKSFKPLQNILELPITFYQQTIKKSTNVNLTTQLYKNQSEKSRLIISYYFNQSFTIAKKNTLSFTVSKKIEQGTLNLYNYNILSNKNTVLFNQSTNSFLPINHFFGFNFLHSKSLKKYLSTGISYTINSKGYINNEENNKFYKTLFAEPFSGNNLKSINFFSTYSTEIINNKSRFSLFLIQSFTSSIEKQMGVTFNSQFASTNLTAKLNLNFTKFAFKAESQVTKSSSAFSRSPQNIKSNEILNLLETKYNFSKKLFLTLETFHNYSKNNANLETSEIIINASIKKIFKNTKWRSTFWVNNVTNNKQYSKISQSVYSRQLSSIPLIPINLLVKLDYIF